MIEVRKADPDDFPRVAELLHHSAADMYDRVAGGRERALRVLQRSLDEPGNASSAEVVWVAAVGDQVAGAMAAFPVDEAAVRARAFLGLALGWTERSDFRKGNNGVLLVRGRRRRVEPTSLTSPSRRSVACDKVFR